jgi:hypothetical protein
MNKGWQCPKCETVYAPFIRKCECSTKKENIYAITVATRSDRNNIKLELFDRSMLVHVEDEHQYYKLNSFDKWTDYTPGKRVVVLNVKL